MSLPVHLNDTEIDEFGRELDHIYEEVMTSRGDRDAAYIRRVIKVQRWLALGGRIVIYASLGLLPYWGHALATWPAFLGVITLGTLMLGTAKILENMEIGHNVMHAQWDWMRDPEIQSSSWEWDTVCPSDQWKHSHNVMHHTWTNVIGKDRDVGYGILRVSEAQAWSPKYLPQMLYNTLLGLFFDWGVALHDVEAERLIAGEKTWKEALPTLKGIGRKVVRQVGKDYLAYPLLAGPFFLYVLGANFTANIIRNVWSYMIIFCGHFPAGSQVFTVEQVENETRAKWYVRQLLGSCNITGGKLFHIMSGNLSHQIEHHLFPDMPSNRYPEVAPRVQALCARYGLAYNSHSLGRQFGTTTWKILRLSLPTPNAA
ncbi:acyl-CoA desaturase [Oleomonas cavernae]|uniref:Acyl-CoA desaturase n=1 Tax=Oleomonas cavernae TaxID=2320859 RepID=A0A418WCQ3_9PROT|nr:acyl-CoA desaturase [Oleomonas cavernae]RJF87770.1 acyl-CoA desaturase [Oleomonas cavernae]